MQKILPEIKLSDIVAKNEKLIPVLNRFGIRLGLGDKSIKMVCKENGIQPSLLICIIGILTDHHYNPQETLQTFSILQLVDYLKKANVYLQKRLEMIEMHIQMLLRKSEHENSNLYLLKKIFQEYKQEMQVFIHHKDTELYPSIIHIYEEYYSPVLEKTKQRDTITFPNNEVSEINEKLSSIKSFIIKQLSGEYDEQMLYSILVQLSQLEAEIDDQWQIENRLLKSIVEKMEENILKAQKKRDKKTDHHTHISISNAKNELLSPREVEVLRLISKGYINKEIAGELKISLHTVISHRKNITEKLSIKSISGLTAYAMKNGII